MKKYLTLLFCELFNYHLKTFIRTEYGGWKYSEPECALCGRFWNLGMREI